MPFSYKHKLQENFCPGRERLMENSLRPEFLRAIGKRLRDSLDRDRTLEKKIQINGVAFDGVSVRGLLNMFKEVDGSLANIRVGFLGLDMKFQTAMRNSRLANKGACGEIVLTPLYFDLRDFVANSGLSDTEALEAWRPRTP